MATAIISSLALQKTVQDLKDGVYSQSSVSPSRQRLIYRGKELQDHVTLSDAGLLDGVVVHLVERMLPRPSEGMCFALHGLEISERETSAVTFALLECTASTPTS
jgi:hypothetical protein